jgi:tetratricopeptide (TPR) repeat protein
MERRLDDETDGFVIDSTITGTAAAEADAAPTATLERRDAIGRYIVLGRLGSGGMGVVYSAYDPELDRRVAVKILRRTPDIDSSRLVREARAMARLQHPNVIAVHDVGAFADGMFVAMELVEGTTLKEWLEHEHPAWPRIVDAFAQAGRGLLAAHAVGIIHRDFKPSNVMVGRDGRVRVGDFGLARAGEAEPATTNAVPEASLSPSLSPSLHETITRSGTLLGTPAYMSPEQLRRQPATAQSDQFGFCVALYHALFGERPFASEDLDTISREVLAGRLRAPPRDTRVPTWIRAIVLRGLAADAAERWPSMDALLAALGRDPARRRQRWLVGVSVVAGLSVLALGYRGVQRRESLVCRGAERKLAGVWDDTRKSAVHAAFAATGKPYAEQAFQGVARALDAFAGAWTSTHTEACEATRLRRDQSEELLDLRMECLGQSLQEAKAQVDLFAGADAQIVEKALQSTSSLLPGLGRCSDVAALRGPVRPPGDAATRARVEAVREKLAQAKARLQAGKYQEGLRIAVPSLEAAQATRYRPLEAEALLTLGKLQSETGAYTAAEKSLEAAVLTALASRDTPVEVDAWAARVAAANAEAKYAEAETWGRYAFAAFEALGGSDERPLAALLENLAAVLNHRGEHEEALAYNRRALAIRQKAFGARSLEAARSLDNVGHTLEDLAHHAEAEAQIRRALEIFEELLGPAHPYVGVSLFNLAYTLDGEGRYDEALRIYRRCATLWEKALGAGHPELSGVYANIGRILGIKGEYEEALAFDRRALEVAERTRGAAHPDVGWALVAMADVLRQQGKYDEALSQYRRAIAVWEHALGPRHRHLALPLTGIGRVELDRHRPALALPPLERARAVIQDAEGDPAENAETLFALARALWESGKDRARAGELAKQARAEYERAGSKSSKQLAEVDQWLAAHH